MTLPVSYSNVGNILTALPAVGSTSAINSAAIFAYIGETEAQINAKISQSYALPFTVEVPVLTVLSTRLTIQRLVTERLALNFSGATEKENPFAKSMEMYQEMLSDIAKGTLRLLDSSGGVIAARAGGVWSSTSGYEPTFTEGAMSDSIQDPDKLDDALRDRGLL